MPATIVLVAGFCAVEFPLVPEFIPQLVRSTPGNHGCRAKEPGNQFRAPRCPKRSAERRRAHGRGRQGDSAGCPYFGGVS
jgi:hypothetical protein